MATYLLLFLEGMITFISPCMLPMLPVYLSYIAGEDRLSKTKTTSSALLFVAGFSLVFVALGAAAGTFGKLLLEYQRLINLFGGLLIVLMGLNFMGAIQVSVLNKSFRVSPFDNGGSGLTSFIFGFIFAMGWTPCVGAFLGTALMMAASSGSTLVGVTMLLTYSLGLGIPFVVSALLIEQLRESFNLIKRHYKVVNTVSGLILIVTGFAMMTGMLNKLLAVLS